ncbi:hypothetical protein BJV82DRAFT_46184 [Fennellomyces sp. T-0311]|nr:hypothetical protein BJV82DRAFT_46184 [Fennellomyces sp. T-0311]
MNEAPHNARKGHQPRDSPRRRAPHPKPNRPRSGSWGAQELHYYMNNADSDDLRHQGRKSRFLSKLKMQRGADSLPGSSSVMTLSSAAVPPAESLSGNNKQKRRPPLPLEMVHPDQSAAAHSTPHPSLARYEEKPLPVEPSLFAMTPAKNHSNSNSNSNNNNTSKKRTTAIRSIGRFFRALGKNQPLETHDIDTNKQPSDPLDEQLSLTINPTTVTTTLQPKQSNDNIPPISEETEDAESIMIPNEKPCLSRKHSTLNCLHTKQQSRPALRRSLSLDDLQRDHAEIPTMQRKRQLILSPGNSRERTNNTTDDESDGDMFVDTDVLDMHAAQESQIAGDRLSKRLSGGHFGSAGGLILSTLQLPSRQTDDEDEEARIASTVHTETSESDTIATPPDPAVRRDSIAPVDPYDKEEDDQEEYNRLAADTAKRIWEQDPTVYSDMEHIAEWIGNGKSLSMTILQHYFLYFDFTNMRLDDAFRKLCGKLHLKAETQQIDRILVEFANRYWDCNPACIFGNSVPFFTGRCCSCCCLFTLTPEHRSARCSGRSQKDVAISLCA